MKPKSIKQTQPFKATIPNSYKKHLIEEALKTGQHYGIFFDTSGKVHVEQVRPTRLYNYVFCTENAIARAMLPIGSH